MEINKNDARIIELSNSQTSATKQAEKQVESENRPLLKVERKIKRQLEVEDAARIWGVFNMTVDENGRIENVPMNYYNLLSKHTDFKIIRLDDFSGQIYYGEELLNDFHLARINNQISNITGGRLSNRNVIMDVIQQIADDNRFNTLTSYLDTLVWDGLSRIPTMFTDFLGASYSDLYSTMSRIWMKAAVMRAYEPGCKFDYIVILSGPQGIGKSNFCERLSVRPEWYCENVQMGDKDGLLQLRNSWIINMDEITSLNKKDAATAKNFITSTSDKFRSPYGRLPMTYKRHCIFIGTTNEDTFLKDTSAVTERRYWVVRCSGTPNDSIERFEKLIPSVVDQLWAEAVYYYKNPDKISIPMYIPESLWQDFKEDQLQYKVENESELFLFLDEALDRPYCDFKNDSSLKDQYKNPDTTGTPKRLQDKFTKNAISMLLADNHIHDWKGALKQYAMMNSDKWEYKKIKTYSHTSVWGLFRKQNENTYNKYEII